MSLWELFAIAIGLSMDAFAVAVCKGSVSYTHLVDDDRKENMDFSASYMNNKQVVVIQADDADKYTDVDSLKTCSIVAEQGSAGESAVADVIGIAVA